MTTVLNRVGNVTLKSPKYGKGNFPANFQCHWNFIGNLKCPVQIVCPVLELKKSPNCATDYLSISDAVGGEAKLCGKAPFKKPKVATAGSKDLYISFQGKTPAKGFLCYLTCAPIKEIDTYPRKAVDLKKVDRIPLKKEPYRKEESGCVCGMADSKANRIVGGEDAKMSEFPWQAALVVHNTRKPLCGGSIINNRYILTAAHCLIQINETTGEKTMKPIGKFEIIAHALLLDMTQEKNKKKKNKLKANPDAKKGEDGFVQSASWDVDAKTDDDEGSVRFKIEEVVAHPMYNATMDFDVALIKIVGKINIKDPTLTPICLPAGKEFLTNFSEAKPFVVGWGKPADNAGGSTRMLQKLAVPIISRPRCKAWLGKSVTERMLCAGYEAGKKDACTGDSGGPLVLKTGQQWMQLGVVSWGDGCAKPFRPGVYSRLTQLYQWINFHVNNDSPSEGVKWCRDTLK